MWCHLPIWGYLYFSQQSWFQFVLHPAQSFSWRTASLNKFWLIFCQKPSCSCSGWILLFFRPVTLEKAMTPHSSTLAWKIPWTEELGRLQSMGSQRVEHNWATSLSLFNFMHWRSKWQPTPVFLPGESQGRGSLVGCRLWGRTELDTTEAT